MYEQSGQTALFIACWFGFLNIAELFLREGADVNLADDVKITKNERLFNG